MLSELRELAKSQADFGFETTLAGRTYAAFLKDLRNAGYAVHLYYLWLPNVDLHIQRVAERVRQGGHDVPEQDIRRRYKRSLMNFFELYQPLADHWAVIDNTGTSPRMIASLNEQGVEVFDAAWYDSFKHKADEYGRNIKE